MTTVAAVTRTPRESCLLLGLLTAGCLLIGVVVGVATGRVWLPGLTSLPALMARPTPGVTLLFPTPVGQISVLLIGVDSLAAARPNLEACWVIVFQPGSHHYYLLGFSPDTLIKRPGETTPQSLSDLYDIDTRLGHDHLFTRDALQVMLPDLSPQAEVVYDRRSLARAVDLLGGLRLYGEPASGDELLARYDALPPADPTLQPWGQPDARLAFQGNALKAMAAAVKQRGWSPETWRPYFDLGQHWNPDVNWFITQVEAALPLSQAEVTILYAPLTSEPTPAP